MTVTKRKTPEDDATSAPSEKRAKIDAISSSADKKAKLREMKMKKERALAARKKKQEKHPLEKNDRIPRCKEFNATRNPTGGFVADLDLKKWEECPCLEINSWENPDKAKMPKMVQDSGMGVPSDQVPTPAKDILSLKKLPAVNPGILEGTADDPAAVKQWFENVIFPCRPDFFLNEVWTKRALKLGFGDVGEFLMDYITNEGGEPEKMEQVAKHINSLRQKRFSKLTSEFLFDLDLDSLIQGSPSDSIFVWLHCGEIVTPETPSNSTPVSAVENRGIVAGKKSDSKKSTSGSHIKKSAQSVQSVEMSGADALKLWKNVPAARALYFRAPAELEEPTLTAFSKALGMDFGAFLNFPGNMKGTANTTLSESRRGEIETFVSKPGHVTNWHQDFQDNFTIQLQGAKRWYLRKGEVSEPVRGIAPHFGKDFVTKENELKFYYQHQEGKKSESGNSSKLQNRNYLPSDEEYFVIRGGNDYAKNIKAPSCTPDEAVTGEVQVVDLYPGDIFYFPNGMWHKVETLPWEEEVEVSGSKGSKGNGSDSDGSDADSDADMGDSDADSDVEDDSDDAQSGGESESGDKVRKSKTLLESDDNKGGEKKSNSVKADRKPENKTVKVPRDSISINFSLMGRRWADEFADSLKQIMYRNPELRSRISRTYCSEDLTAASKFLWKEVQKTLGLTEVEGENEVDEGGARGADDASSSQETNPNSNKDTDMETEVSSPSSSTSSNATSLTASKIQNAPKALSHLDVIPRNLLISDREQTVDLCKELQKLRQKKFKRVPVKEMQTPSKKGNRHSTSRFCVSPLAALVPAKEASTDSESATWAIHIGFTEEAMSKVRIELKVRSTSASEAGSTAASTPLSNAACVDAMLRAVSLRAHTTSSGDSEGSGPVNCVVGGDAIMKECRKLLNGGLDETSDKVDDTFELVSKVLEEHGFWRRM